MRKMHDENSPGLAETCLRCENGLGIRVGSGLSGIQIRGLCDVRAYEGCALLASGSARKFGDVAGTCVVAEIFWNW